MVFANLNGDFFSILHFHAWYICDVTHFYASLDSKLRKRLRLFDEAEYEYHHAIQVGCPGGGEEIFA